MTVSDRRPPRLGILGGGQLARMMVPPAHRLGVTVYVLETFSGSPAALAGAIETVGDWNDAATLKAFAADLDAVTLDSEFMNAAAIAELEAIVPVFPTSASLALIQDKLVQKQTLESAGFAVAPFRNVPNLDALLEAGDDWGWPVILKARRGGYDGKGNIKVDDTDEAEAAWNTFGSLPGGCYVEQFVPFVREVAMMVTRGRTGETVQYPLVETIQRDHICHEVLLDTTVDRADLSALNGVGIAEAFDVVGDLGIEAFEMADGSLLINELAPRPHNTGHYTIEACRTSQFENHVRAVLDLPLGDPSPIVPAAVMVNLLADSDGPGMPGGMVDALTNFAALHLYGKAVARKGRKMGHITAVGADLGETRDRAWRAANALTFQAGG